MLTRRDFLRRGIVVLSAGLALPPIFGKAVSASAEAISTDPMFKDRVLVIVQMAGGNDGLNTVIPFAQGKYHDLRANIGIADSEVIPLNDGVGLHPSLAKFKELWDQGVLGVVQGAGYPNPNLSHFRSMEIWQTANPDKPATDGWAGRYLQVLDEDGHPLDGLSVGSLLPMAMRASNTNVAVVDNLANYQLRADGSYPDDKDARLNALMNLYAKYPNRAPYAAVFQAVGPDAQQSAEALQQATAGYVPGATYPTNSLGTGLKTLAQAINANMGIKVFHIGIGGFDTHSNQLATQTRLLQQLAEGLSAFYKDLQAHGKDKDVLVMTWSEFGRRPSENANRGTDHGTAGPMFLIGSQVRSGLYGETPSLTNLDHDNLKYTLDFRSVYSTVLSDWMGAPAQDILGANFEHLPLLAGVKFMRQRRY